MNEELKRACSARPFYEALKTEAHAKINLSLDILGRREDGYHLLRMVLHSLALHDEVTLCRIPEEEIRLEIRDLRGKDSAPGSVAGTAPLPAGQDNLMVKAAKLMLGRLGLAGGISMELVKRIPSEAGLGGGSADAAAVISGILALSGQELSREELVSTALKIGADVPYCLLGGTALAEGIGEELRSVETELVLPVLVIKPCRGLSTPAVYHAYDNAVLSGRVPKAPDTAGLLAALERGDPEGVCKMTGNVLEPPAAALLPLIERIREDLLKYGARAACMTGSGSAVFGIFSNQEELKSAAGGFRGLSYAGLLSDILETESSSYRLDCSSKISRV